jgi:hypothetical protein
LTIERVITGGQTGADQAAWRAAKKAGIATGGWMPKGFLTEDRPRPEFADLYGATEHPSPDYPPRTRSNAEQADALVWFGNPYSPGGRLTLQICAEVGLDCYIVINPGFRGDKDTPSLPVWLDGTNALGPVPAGDVRTLMIAGNRESKTPGIGAWVEAYLDEVFGILKDGR